MDTQKNFAYMMTFDRAFYTASILLYYVSHDISKTLALRVRFRHIFCYMTRRFYQNWKFQTMQYYEFNPIYEFILTPNFEMKIDMRLMYDRETCIISLSVAPTAR